jgi:sucrose-6-phosphate hydrolase SacC (GH32 family)
VGPGVGQTTFQPITPQQQLAHGAACGHGFYDNVTQSFVWYGWVPGQPPPEPGVPSWDSSLTLSRKLEADWALSPNGEFNGTITQYPVDAYTSLRGKTLFTSGNAWPVGQPHGEFWLPAASGDCIDLEVIIFPLNLNLIP